MGVTSSTAAAGVVPALGKRMSSASAMSNPRNLALMAAAFGATLFGGIGLGASMMLDRHKNSEIAKDQKKILADHYREQVAAQLGISPDRVSAADLELAAKVNPQMAQLIKKVDLERDRNDRAAVIATGSGLALGGVLPGVSVVSGIAGKGVAATVGHVGGAIGGGMASGILNKDHLFTQDVVEHIDNKMQQGQPVTSFDVMMLRISQDEKLQDGIKKQTGKVFHKLDEAQQRAVAASMPDLYSSAEGDAEAINAGRVTQQDLLVTSPGAQPAKAPAPWAQRVGGKRAQQGSFVQAYQAEQAAGPGRAV